MGFQAAYQATLTDQKVKEMMSGFFDDRGTGGTAPDSAVPHV